MPYEAATKLEERLKLIGTTGMVVSVMGLLLYQLFVRPEPTPAPSNHSAYGCFLSRNAPSILLDEEGMKIDQNGFPVIGFNLQQFKGNIVLAVERPISAYPDDTGYSFAIEKVGMGRDFPFYRTVGDRIYYVSDEAELVSFQMATEDSRPLTYSKADVDRCR